MSTVSFYFDRFEDRLPPAPLAYSPARERLWQLLAGISLGLGAWYIAWRWTGSLNSQALWFAIPLALAETGAYIGLALFTWNLWADQPPVLPEPPRLLSECTGVLGAEERPLRVDVFFTTYSEDPELVRRSLADAKRMSYPYPIEIQIHVLDDGKREAMRQVAVEEGVGYLTRTGNAGFKAGNLRNALEQTGGDFVVICDADTRPFPTLLAHTLGYFRDPDMAWVQTPQWFFDLPEGRRLPAAWGRRLGRAGRFLGRAVEACIGPVTVGADPFVNDPQMFYDVLLRRRNRANAVFCCGAGSVHRREAVLQAAIRIWARQIEETVASLTAKVEVDEVRADLDAALRHQVALDTELTPYKFHVSEDIYTSIVLHEDRGRRWKSFLHPWVETKMLSPQDLQTWVVQRFKYAGGTLDICLHDNPLFRRGLSLPQRLMYGATFWSYLGGLWNVVFLVSPIVYLWTGIAPVASYSFAFFAHALPFLIANELATMVGTWGVMNLKGKASFISFFSLNLRALWTVLRGETVKFPVTPKERQSGTFYRLVTPQIAVIALTLAGLLGRGVALFAFGRGDLGAYVTNLFWGLNNVYLLSGIVRAAGWTPEGEEGAAS
jgi:cellulose synthase (UDP-forming)